MSGDDGLGSAATTASQKESALSNDLVEGVLLRRSLQCAVLLYPRFDGCRDLFVVCMEVGGCCCQLINYVKFLCSSTHQSLGKPKGAALMFNSSRGIKTLKILGF